MNNKEIIEKVLEDFFSGDIIKDAYVNSYLDQQIKEAIEKALAEKDKQFAESVSKLKEEFKDWKDGIIIKRKIDKIISNFNPLKNKEEEFSKKIDEAKFLTKMQKFMINDKILGMKYSHNLKDGVS